MLFYIIMAILVACIITNKPQKHYTDDELFPQNWKDENVPDEFKDL